MPATTSDRPTTLHCSFCGKSEDAVARLISGPNVYICGECVEDCNVLLDERKESDASQG